MGRGQWTDATQFECSGTDSDQDYCNPTEAEILVDEWPEDGCVNLAIKGGKIVGSKYDPENDGTYSKPMSEIELCDGQGESIYLAPAANGGWKSIDSTKTNGYLYDSSGQQIAHIDGNEYADPNI
ncbi:hypothetical protein ACFPTY_03410 [Halomonas beimenensis]|uniref:Uncharacterized protein n=1 Tax=Halomonas beimenensis TaxID=475662 RepID=A0A291P549_9GAMM|nr:hypothetical protein [Halomonas beimenensis]ATJ82006.1 hypothetical protein BEI_1019 [Halomonas beimenensis]